MWAAEGAAHVGAALRRRATPPCILAVCAGERRHGPCREQPPLSSDDGKGQGRGRRASWTTPRARRLPLPGRQARCSLLWTTMGMCLPPGRHLSLRCGHSRWFCGTPRCTSSTSCRTCSRFSMCLCHRWGTRSYSALWTGVVRRRRNSWWKCRRCCPSLLSSSRLPSRSSTFQFLIVVVVVREVVKFFPQSRIQQHGLWNRTFTLQFPEVACMFSLILVVEAHPQLLRDQRGEGFFSDFLTVQKSPKSAASLSPRVPARSSSWTPAAYAGVQAADEYFEYNGALWKQAWDQEHHCYCWCIVDPDNGFCFLPVWQPPRESIPEPPRYMVMALWLVL